MNNNRSQDQETPVVAGFEVPRSPDASYNNVYTASEDDGRDPPVVPQHLQHTVLSYPTNGGSATPLPDPQHVVLNHLYIENREAPRKKALDDDDVDVLSLELRYNARKVMCGVVYRHVMM
uniref:SNF1-related protein kinase regulatory subunit beta-3 n=1 Tax=Tanacetum cinerariifolium TaxID=118510 RepID=A0A6L2L6I5_TANCI|nr:SNF1-related protein kinase regulatory subunit beta-3 [Tanacetum cinerariifolium]